MGFRDPLFPPTQHHRLSVKGVIELVVEFRDVGRLVVSLLAIRTIPFNHEVRVMWWMNILLYGQYSNNRLNDQILTTLARGWRKERPIQQIA